MDLVLRHHDHEPIFEEVTVHYIFTWAATGPLNVRSIANKLLASGIAETVGSPAYPEVRISPVFSDLRTQVRRLGKLMEVYRIRTRLGFAKWLLRHPRIAAPILVEAIRNRQREKSATRAKPDFDKILKEINGIVSEVQAVNAIQHAIESDLYAPGYLEREPYLRLTLRGFPCWLEITDGGAVRASGDMSAGILAQPVLLVHRSGTIQLTIVLQLPNSLSIDAISKLTIARNVRIKRTEVAEPILKHQARTSKVPETQWPGQWASGLAAGTRWRQYDHEPAASLVDVLTMYRDAMENACGIRSLTEWLCYPVVFIDSLGCCRSEQQWRSRHENVLRQIVFRGPHLMKLPELIDYSSEAETSFYCHEGAATEIRWKFTAGRSDYASQLQRVVVVEHVLLRYWQLVALAERLRSVEDRQNVAEVVQREAIFGLNEYRRSALAYGTAKDIASAILALLGERELYQGIFDSLQLLQQMIATGNARRSSRTANIVAAVAIVALVVLGLPTVDASLAITRRLHAKGIIGWIARPLRDLAARGALGVWEVYLAVVAIVVVTVLISAVARLPRRRFSRSKPPGILWPYSTVAIVRSTGQRRDGRAV